MTKLSNLQINVYKRKYILKIDNDEYKINFVITQR